jgi:hypothetical protein
LSLNLVRTISIATFACLTATTAYAQEDRDEAESNWTDLLELPRDENGNWILPDIDVMVTLARPEITDQEYRFLIPFEWLDYRIPPLRREAAAGLEIEDRGLYLLAILRDGEVVSTLEAHNTVVQHIGQISLRVTPDWHFEGVLMPRTSADLPDMIRHTETDSVRYGLRELAMPPARQREELAYVGEHNLAGPIAVTCVARSPDMERDRPPPDEGYCRLVFEYEDGLSVFFSYPQHQFHHWESIATSIHELISGFEQAAAVD